MGIGRFVAMKAGLKWLGLIVLLGPLLGTLIHELSHLLMVWVTDAAVIGLSVFGRYQLYPEMAMVENMGAGFKIDIIFPDITSKGLVQISGALSTFIISLAAMAGYSRRRSNVMIIFIAYGLDLVAYLAMPLHGLRRWLLFGAPYSEVIEGLSLLGIAPGPAPGTTGFAFVFLAIYLAVMITYINFIRKPQGVTSC